MMMMMMVMVYINVVNPIKNRVQEREQHQWQDGNQFI
jgi:hypothetical protein